VEVGDELSFADGAVLVYIVEEHTAGAAVQTTISQEVLPSQAAPQAWSRGASGAQSIPALAGGSHAPAAAARLPFRPPAVVAKAPKPQTTRAPVTACKQDAEELMELETTAPALVHCAVAAPAPQSIAARIPGPAAKYLPSSGDAAPPRQAEVMPQTARPVSDAELLATFDDDDVPPPIEAAAVTGGVPALQPAASSYKRLHAPSAVPALHGTQPLRPPPVHVAQPRPAPVISFRDAASLHPSGANLSFPSEDEVRGAAARNGTVERRVVVPTSMADRQAYADVWVCALVEDVRIKVTTSKMLQKWLAMIDSLPRDLRAQQLEAPAKRAGLPFVPHATLCVWLSGSEFCARGRPKKKQRRAPAESEEDSGGEDGGEDGDGPQFRLQIPEAYRQRSNAYKKGDLWVISTSHWLWPFGADAARVTSGANWSVMAVSTFHAPTPSGELGLQLLGPRPPGFTANSRKLTVSALKCVDNLSQEMCQLDALATLLRQSGALVPVLPPLLGRAQARAPPVAPACDVDCRLNADQAEVVQHLVSLAQEPSAPASSGTITLVHGPFGCGKTHTLAAAVRSLLAANPSHRALLTACTNAAVDRMLSALLASGFSDFVRVGHLPSMAAEMLPYALSGDHGGAKRNATQRNAAELQDLRQRLATTRGFSARRAIQTEVDARLRDGVTVQQQRARRLATSRCVATTLASASCTALQKHTFSFVFIDEASQATEPQAVLPALLLGAHHIVLVGDPQQLPPQATNGAAPRPDGADISRPLFVRLQLAGCRVNLLRTQYRCHPALSAIPNAAFYNGQLLDGVSANDRPPLLPRLPHLVFLDMRVGMHNNRHADGSVSNAAEATLVGRLVELLSSQGIQRGDIAIITPYREQVKALRFALGMASPGNNGAAAPGAEEEEDGTTAPDAGDGAELLVGTIDSLQGQERPVVLLSMCGPGSRAFATHQRVNVALTRAKTHLIVLGRAPVLAGEPWWEALLLAARKTPTAYLCIDRTDVRLPLWATPPPPPPVHAEPEAPPCPPPVLSSDAVMANECLPPAHAVLEAPAAQDGSWNDAWGSKTWTGSTGAHRDALAHAAEATSAPSVLPSPSPPPMLDSEAAVGAAACAVDIEAALSAAQFTSNDLWQAYREFGLYPYTGRDKIQKELFLKTALGRIMRELYPNKRSIMSQPLFLKVYSRAESYGAWTPAACLPLCLLLTPHVYSCAG